MKRSKFEKIITRISDLPTLPTVAQRALSLIHNNRSRASDLQEIIELDPVLSARVLQLANSAYYRTPGADRVADVHRAVVVLGFMNIRNIVLTTCVRSMYGKEYRTKLFSASDLWVHSVAVAVVARMIAERIDRSLVDEAFMAGIVHDVGIIVEWSTFPDLFPTVLQRFQGTGRSFIAAERDTLGFDHCAAGAAILRKWQLPQCLREVARHHHREKWNGHDQNRLVGIIQAAEQICCERGNGFFDFVNEQGASAEALEAIGLTDDIYREATERMNEEMEKAKDILAL